MIYIIDTYAWVEYFKGSNQGSVLKNLFGNINDKFVTMECCIAELMGFCLKNKVEFNKMYNIVKSNSIILPIMIDLWINSAKIKFELRKKIKNFGLIDSILVAKQHEFKCKVVSGDPHFKTLKNMVHLDVK